MLVRFIVDNLYSFGKRTEFNTLPGKPRTLSEHVYNLECGVKVLKLSALYGANAAGKSNLVSAIALLEGLVLGNIDGDFVTTKRFKLERHEGSDEQLLAVEFVQDGDCFLYAIKVVGGRIAVEELYQSGKSKDILIYERTTDEKLVSDIHFSPEFEEHEKNRMLKDIILTEFVEPKKPVIQLLANRENEQLAMVRNVFTWFKLGLNVLAPEPKPAIFEQRFETDKGFMSFVQDVVKTYHVGISNISVEKTPLEDAFGRTAEGREISDKLRNSIMQNPLSVFQFVNRETSERFLLVREDDDIWVKQIQLEHRTYGDKGVQFNLSSESDGTVKLLNLLPAIYDVIHNRHVYVIDELERSIHPSLIKELVRKFSHDDKSLGQLIFTTHESVLLDQNIFRQDEIWFAEKDNGGCTELYSLSQYREHKTIDIRKGYLEGRYGAIPFLGNLKDLNWHDNRE